MMDEFGGLGLGRGLGTTNWFALGDFGAFWRFCWFDLILVLTSDWMCYIAGFGYFDFGDLLFALFGLVGFNLGFDI